MSTHYIGQAGTAYFQQRTKCRHPKAQSESSLPFARYATRGMTVVDFGCGTGGILKSLDVARKIGVELNESSQLAAAANGLYVVGRVDALQDSVADLIITNHALEHVADPLATLVSLRPKLKAGGKLVVVVPSENGWTRPFSFWEENIEQHLYSWTPRSLGNLLEASGYKVQRAENIPNGYSHYLEPFCSIPILFPLLKTLNAKLRGRYSVIAVGMPAC